MKYRKAGLRMCIISIIMIALCIPNQIQIANAEEGTGKVRIIDQNQVEWSETDWLSSDNETLKELKIFPENKEGKDWNIEPGDEDKYGFSIINQTNYKMDCTIKIESNDGKKYPIEYQLCNEKDMNENLLGEGWKNPSDTSNIIMSTVRVEKGRTETYYLKWRFNEEESNYEKGTYTLKLKVKSEQVIDSDDNTPVNPDNGNKDNNNSDNNQGNNTNNGSDDSKGNESSNNNQNNKDNLNIDQSSSKETGSTTNKKKVNTSDITTPVIYVALMILMFGLILLVKSRKEN